MRIIVADNHPLTLLGTKLYINKLGYNVLASCTEGKVAWKLIHKFCPDVIVLDVGMQDMDGIDILRKVRAASLTTKVVFVTSHREASIYKTALAYHVDGYILKNQATSELASCLATLNKGEKWLNSQTKNDIQDDNKFTFDTLTKDLTNTEHKILNLIAHEKTSKEISMHLYLSVKTVEAHRTNIIEKLCLPKKKNTLVNWAIKHSESILKQACDN